MLNRLITILAIFFILCSVSIAKELSSIKNPPISKLNIVLPYKDISKSDFYISKLMLSSRILSDVDKKTISKYVCGAVKREDTFLLINCFLRNNLSDYIKQKDINKPLKSRLNYYAEALSKSVSKSKLPQNIILYKPLDEKDLKYIFKGKDISCILNKKSGLEDKSKFVKSIKRFKYTENGFLITYYDKSMVKNKSCLLEIRAPKNLQAVLIDEITKKHTKSVLINSGYRWKVTNIVFDSSNNNYNCIITVVLSN